MLAVIACVVAPLDQRYELPEFAVNVTLPPGQNVVGPPGVIVAVAAGLTVTAVAAEVVLQPDAFVTLTVKLPLALTVIDCVVPPDDQSQELPALAVNVTLPPGQNVVGPPAVIVAAGAAFTVTAVGADVVLQPDAFVTRTV